uniref:Cytochrome P450 n=1 Tax=Arcella intermedia TaxID=1963864 RepID=A0A6B2L4U5_9EUKA
MAVDPDASQFILKNSQTFRKCNDFVPSRKLKDEIGLSIVVANDDDWRRHRSFSNSAFTTDSYKSYYPSFVEITNKFISKLSQLKGEDINFTPWSSRYTLDVLGKSMFHYDFQNLDSESDEYYNAYREVMDNMVSRNLHAVLLAIFPFIEKLPLSANNHLHNSLRKLIFLFDKVIAERNKGETEKYGDILDHLLEGNQDNALSRTEFVSDLAAFFIAGHETTASALCWAVVELAERKEVQERLYEEIVREYGEGVPDFEELHHNTLPYLDWFIKENLRMHAPVNLFPSRIAVADAAYKNQVIPKGSYIGFATDVIHYHPDFWEEPEKFDPERFSPERKKGRHKFAYQPFSLGARQCIGMDFSELEQKLFLVKLLQNFQVVPPETLPKTDLKEPIPFGKLPISNIRLLPRQST